MPARSLEPAAPPEYEDTDGRGNDKVQRTDGRNHVRGFPAGLA